MATVDEIRQTWLNLAQRLANAMQLIQVNPNLLPSFQSTLTDMTTNYPGFARIENDPQVVTALGLLNDNLALWQQRDAGREPTPPTNITVQRVAGQITVNNATTGKRMLSVESLELQVSLSGGQVQARVTIAPTADAPSETENTEVPPFGTHRVAVDSITL